MKCNTKDNHSESAHRMYVFPRATWEQVERRGNISEAPDPGRDYGDRSKAVVTPPNRVHLLVLLNQNV